MTSCPICPIQLKTTLSIGLSWDNRLVPVMSRLCPSPTPVAWDTPGTKWDSALVPTQTRSTLGFPWVGTVGTDGTRVLNSSGAFPGPKLNRKHRRHA